MAYARLSRKVDVFMPGAHMGPNPMVGLSINRVSPRFRQARVLRAGGIVAPDLPGRVLVTLPHSLALPLFLVASLGRAARRLGAGCRCRRTRAGMVQLGQVFPREKRWPGVLDAGLGELHPSYRTHVHRGAYVHKYLPMATMRAAAAARPVYRELETGRAGRV